MAPECFRGEFSAASDIWAVGVATQFMSHRSKLFGPSSDAENKVLNWNDDNNLISKIMISKELQNVIKAMLKFNPMDRKSAKEYLQMEFFNKYPRIQPF